MAKQKGNLFWPSVENEALAREACRNGGAMSFFVAGMTALFSVLSLAGVEFATRMGMSGWSLIDAVLFALFGWGMLRCSRVAAVAALVVFVVARLLLLTSGVTAGTILAVFVVLSFVGAVRGAFALHRFRTAAPSHSGLPQ